MIESIAAAVTGLKTAADIAKTFVELKSIGDVQAKAIELQSVILAAQASALAANSDQFALLQRVRELEEEMARMKEWNAEKQRYELKTVYPGAFAYALKPEAGGSEPPHWLCATCYQQSRKSILQDHGFTPKSRIDRLWACSTCKAHILVEHGIRPEGRD